MTLWKRWVAFVGRDMDARPLALVRICVCLAILLDLLEVARLGLVPVLFRPFDAGGLSVVQDPAGILPAISAQWAGPVAFALVIVAFGFAALGVAIRPALVVGIVIYAQLGHLFPPGDRAIDRLLRTVLLILVFSGSHGRFTLTGNRRDRVPAWPADTIRWLLVILYVSAGIGKLQQQPAWIGWVDPPVLYRVMTDPLSAHVDPLAAQGWTLALRLLGWGTIALELSAPLLFTRFAPYWALGGAAMHLGIAMAMELGMFSWGMLALYPLLFWPFLARLFPERPASG